jgi:hypothetical protein
MYLFALLLLSLVVIVLAAVVRGRIKAARDFARCSQLPSWDGNHKKLRRNCYSHWIFERVFGLWFAVGKQFGNCFSPALVLEWKGMRKRWSSHTPINPERFAQMSTSMQERMLKAQAKRMGEPLEWFYPAWAQLTYRSNHRETRLYWRGWLRFDLHSDHIAEWWGEPHDAPHGTVWTYRGLLGSHQSV